MVAINSYLRYALDLIDKGSPCDIMRCADGIMSRAKELRRMYYKRTAKWRQTAIQCHHPANNRYGSNITVLCADELKLLFDTIIILYSQELTTYSKVQKLVKQ